MSRSVKQDYETTRALQARAQQADRVSRDEERTERTPIIQEFGPIPANYQPTGHTR